MTNLILIGFKNSGKTSVGKLLAEKLNKVFIDTDNLIIQKYQKDKSKNHSLLTCREILQKHGETYFRKLEKKVITDLLDSSYSDYVDIQDNIDIQNRIIATGGGCVLYPENVRNLKKLGTLIYLVVPYQILKERLFQQAVLPSYLDPLEPEKSFKLYYEKLESIFNNISDLKISAENKSFNEISEDLISKN